MVIKIDSNRNSNRFMVLLNNTVKIHNFKFKLSTCVHDLL